MIDCKTALMLAELRGPFGTDIAPEDVGALDQHLAGCAACAQKIRRQARFEANMAKAMIAVPIPVGLKARILDNLAHERAGWYRRRFWQVSAAAAAVLLVVGLSLNWKREHKTELDMAALTTQVDRVNGNLRDAAEAWFAREQIAFNPNFHPEIAFDYRMLFSYGPQEMLPGKMVPSLTFVNYSRGVKATVYIVRGDQFNVTNLREDTLSCRGSGYQVDIVKDLRIADQWYVIVYNGADLKAFESKNQSA